MFTSEQAKVTLKKRGWSNRRAAKRLRVCYQHLNMVLNGRRESARLLRAIEHIPEAPEVVR